MTTTIRPLLETVLRSITDDRLPEIRIALAEMATVNASLGDDLKADLFANIGALVDEIAADIARRAAELGDD